MAEQLMFDRLIHADRGVKPNKRWMAVAVREGDGWQIAAPKQVPTSDNFLSNCLLDGASVLAGFDFPIGVPVKFGKQTRFNGFLEALEQFGKNDWTEIFNVAERPEDISLYRPFYPAKSKKGSKRADLHRALDVASDDELRRASECKTQTRGAACPLFWTLGGNQVGKDTISGWQEVLQPALKRGARLWPFHGNLSELSRSSKCVICETYPREAYVHLGITVKGKRKQEVRLEASQALMGWAARNNIVLSDDASIQLSDGFGPSKAGEDPFDAFVGLASMIEVIDGRRKEGTPFDQHRTEWEGWILGQEPLESIPLV
jgi:hypothetical protein